MSSSEHKTHWLHFTGAGGSGMSALVQFHALAGDRVTGSDRAFDQGERPEIRAALEKLGVEIVPQDGSFASASTGCEAVVVSTAVEDKVPDIRAARDAGIPILHRSELLARHVADHRSIAVTGTSGKSTVTAMIFEVLRAAGLGPGLLTGGALAALQAGGHLGNAWAPAPAAGQTPLLVIEADESDGSLVRYAPWLGVVLNLGLDHKEPAEVMDMFRTFGDHTTGPLVLGADAVLDELAGPDALRFGLADERRVGAGCFATGVVLGPDHVDFSVDGVDFRVPAPGRHTVLNATATLAAGRACGLEPADMAPALAEFGGVARRFVSMGTAGGVEVIDDFAHNPDKIEAALAAAHGRTRGRVLAVFQPHGFGPTRFLRDALVATFGEALAGDDVLWLPEIYFAGGTVTRDISSRDLVDAVVAGGRDARFHADRADLPGLIAAEAKPGDLVLVMGARDPGLTGLCRDILDRLGT